MISGVHEEKHKHYYHHHHYHQQTVMRSPAANSPCRTICSYSPGPGLGGAGRWGEGWGEGAPQVRQTCGLISRTISSRLCDHTQVR